MIRRGSYPNNGMSESKTLLVTGATGKQGGAVIRAIYAFEMSSAFNIVAVTRSMTFRSAQALASHLNVFSVEGYC